jgi:drug/metabolite transporter (DMT)-like permease
MLPISHFIMKDKVNSRAIIGVIIAVCGVGLLMGW